MPHLPRAHNSPGAPLPPEAGWQGLGVAWLRGVGLIKGRKAASALAH